jgi:hypothetical protein
MKPSRGKAQLGAIAILSAVRLRFVSVAVLTVLRAQLQRIRLDCQRRARIPTVRRAVEEVFGG